MGDNFTQITPRAADRIARAVRTVEAIPTDRRYVPNPFNSIGLLQPVIVQITATATRYGCYKGKLITLPASSHIDFTAASGIALSDIGSSSSDCWVVNLAEAGSTSPTYMLDPSSTENIFCGMTFGIAADNLPVVYIVAYYWGDCAT